MADYQEIRYYRTEDDRFTVLKSGGKYIELSNLIGIYKLDNPDKDIITMWRYVQI